MALRWVRTIDEAPHTFASRDEENADWLLYCGAWQVGRVHRPGGVQQRVLSWSLTGPHTPEAPMDKHGDAATVEEAKERLITALRHGRNGLESGATALMRDAGFDAGISSRWASDPLHDPQPHPRGEAAPGGRLVSSLGT